MQTMNVSENQEKISQVETKENKVSGVLKNANKLLSKIPIRLGDDVFLLEFNMYALMRLHEDCGINLMSGETIKELFPELLKKIDEFRKEKATELDVTKALLNSLNPRLLCQVVWAGILSDTKAEKFTVEDVAKRFDAGTIEEILSVIGGMQQGIVAALPGEGEEKKSL